VAKPVRRDRRRLRQDAGAESLAKLKELVGARIAGEYATVARMKLKQQIWTGSTRRTTSRCRRRW
jgi:hypothetical protein